MNKLISIIIGLVLQFSDADDIIDTITNRSFPAESHFVKTRDDYILGLYRIPCTTCVEEQTSNERRNHTRVMLLMHGMTATARSYIVPHKSAAGYYFFKTGYDIWLGNARGNSFSRNHTTLDPEKLAFWEYSWHEIGVYDLSAIIDYILAQTNETQLIYVGHSQGSTIVFVLLCELPEYNEKIAMIHAMTPPVIFKYTPSFASLFSMKNAHTLQQWLEKKNLYEVSTATSIIRRMIQFCTAETTIIICRNIMFQLFGPSDLAYDHMNMMLIMTEQLYAGASYRQLLHYIQIMITGKFQKYNHGKEENMKLYGTQEPPEYNLSNINTKIHLMYGSNDYVVRMENMPILSSILKSNVIASSEFKGFNHIDFQQANGVQLVQNKIENIINKFLI